VLNAKLKFANLFVLYRHSKSLQPSTSVVVVVVDDVNRYEERGHLLLVLVLMLLVFISASVSA